LAIYTSRFQNPQLKSGAYTAVQISLGRPKFFLGYEIDGVLSEVMPRGLLGRYDYDPVGFKREYFKLLERNGLQRIQSALRRFEAMGKDVVLLCFEDVRKGDNDWCHRVMLAEWLHQKTGLKISELPDPTPDPREKARRQAEQAAFDAAQTTLF